MRSRRRNTGPRTRLAATLAAALVALGALPACDGSEQQDSPAGPSPSPSASERSAVEPTPLDDAVAAARAVLADPEAAMDLDRWRVNASGSILTVVVAPPEERPEKPDPCQAAYRSAWVLLPAGSDPVAWTGEATSRLAESVTGGFVVGEILPDCRTPGNGDRTGAYFLSDTGERRPVRWETQDAAEVCAGNPGDVRCAFSLADGTGLLVSTSEPRLPPGALDVVLRDPGSDRLWARSVDSRRLFWTDDRGETWSQHRAHIAQDSTVQATWAGDHVAFVGGNRVEHSTDGGRTWQVRDLSAAVRRLPDEGRDWTVTTSGTLLVAPQPDRTGNRLYRSTDLSYARFAPTPVRTRLRLTQAEVAGSWVYVIDDDHWWRSADDGRTWDRPSPFD